MSWNKIRLGEFAPFIYGKGLPSKNRIAGDVPVYGSNGIVGGHNQALVSEPVVIIGRKGSVGEVHLTSGPSWPIDTTFYAESSDKADLDFLFYLLQTLPLKTNSDSAVPGLSRDYAHSLEVRVPNVVMQTAIGKVLKSLDFKIANNSALSKTLEEIAQAIFKSWFIDFDPVRAMMAGEKPVGMDDATAALFPDSMEDSELGPIPKGWECKTADNIFSVGIGRTPPRKEPEWFCEGGDGVDWVSIRDMGSYGVFSSGTSEGLTEEAVKKFRVPIVPKGTVLMSFKLTVGKLCITDRDLVTNEAIAHFKQNESSPISSLFAYLWLSNHDMESLDSTSSIGTATNSGLVKAIKFLIPSVHAIGHFESLASPLFNQIESLTAQSRKLVELRDSLLPRLISGELQIPEEMLVS